MLLFLYLFFPREILVSKLDVKGNIVVSMSLYFRQGGTEKSLSGVHSLKFQNKIRLAFVA